MIIENEKIRYMYPEFERIRSQDLQPIYHDCGQFYICKVDAFKESGSIITKKTIAFIMPEEEVQDIDNISDWILAEEKYRLFFDRNKK